MIGLLNGNFMQGESRMSLLAMDTSSLFDPFAYPPEIDPEPPKPEAKFREKLEIKPLRHQEPQVKTYFSLREPEFKTRENQGVSVKEVVDVTTHHSQSKLKMVDTLSPQPASDMHTVRQKLRDSLTSALEMVVSKQLVKNVLGVVKDSKKDVAEMKSISKFEVSHPDSVLQENGDPNSNRQNGDDSLVVDLGFLDNEAGNKDEIGGESPFPDQLLFNGAEARSNYDQLERSENTDVAESPLKKLKTQFGHSDSFHRKLEIEEKEGRIAVEDVKGGLHLMDQARKLATVIEADLFKLYGFKKTYNQKARSLLFNLKDKSNPELRARVFSGEITPADLCRMSAEQLASKELSDWRNAKEQALDKWVVLTDADVVSGKVVKKTHKGEFVVDVQNENTVDIIPVVTRSVFPQKDKLEAKSENVTPEHMETSVNDTADFRIQNSPHSGSSPSLKRSRSGNSTHLESSQTPASKSEEGLVPSESTPERSDPELMEVEKGLPAILSLDEYMDAQVNDSQSGYQEDVFEDAPIEPRASVKHTHSEVHEAPDISGSPNPYKANEDAGFSNSVKSPSAKDGEDASAPVKQVSNPVMSKREEAGVVWAGQIQFSSNRQSTLSVIYQSGERVDLKNWPKSLELKGRVRLAHLDKFLQDLQQSRSRAVTVVSLFVQEGIADQKNVAAHVKEVSSQYQMGDRVGFVEPRSGYELYLLPPGTGTMKLLSEHGHPEILSESQGREVVLVGVIVWRKSQLSTSRLPDRNNNVKRHAVASSSHHESISKSSRAGVGLGKDPAGSDHRPSLRGGPPNVSSALSSMHLTKFQVESPTKEDTSLLTRNLPPLTPTNANVLNSHHVSHAAIKPPSDTSADVPPGFSLRQSDSSLGPSVALRQSPSLSAAQGGRDAPPGFWPRAAPQSTPAQRPLPEDDDDDDDLPEFDFGGQSVSGGLPPSTTQFSGSNLSGHPTQFQARPGPSPAESHTPPNSSEFPPAAGFPPGLPPPPPPPPSQDPTTFLRRNPPPYANGGGPVVAMSGVGQGQGQGQVMLGHLGPPPLQANVAQYSGVSPPPPPLPPPQQGNPLPRNDLPEWCPSAQFQLWPPPVYEADPRQMGAAPSRPPFDPSGPPLPMQEINWPPSQQQPPPQQQQQQQQQHQQHPSLPLPPPPHYVQEPPRNFQPPQWQQQQQQQQQQHSSHFQQQQHLPARPSDLRGSYGWESAAPAWDASTRGGREPAGGGSIEQNRDTRSRVEPAAARAKDPRMSELSWHERERDQNGGRPEFGRR